MKIETLSPPIKDSIFLYDRFIKGLRNYYFIRRGTEVRDIYPLDRGEKLINQKN